MKLDQIFGGLLLAIAACAAQAYPGVLRSAEEIISDHAASCPRTVTPDTMAECSKKGAGKGAALERYQQERRKAGEPEFNFGTKMPAKPGGLCFTRKATGEVVCPN